MFSSKLILGGMLFLATASLQGNFSLGMSLSTLSDVEKIRLEELREMVQELHFSQEYMKDDAYLLRYLSFQDFNPQAAFDRLKHHLEARKRHNIDSVLDEDWSDLEERFPYDLSRVTKEGRLILYVPYGKWDLSKEIASGDFKRFSRYSAVKILEEADRKAHSLRKENGDIATFDIISNLDGYTLEKHGCFQCLMVYPELLKLADSLYKEVGNRATAINAPLVLESIYPWLASFIMDDKSRAKLRVLAGRSSFEPVLLQEINREQIPKGIFIE